MTPETRGKDVVESFVRCVERRQPWDAVVVIGDAIRAAVAEERERCAKLADQSAAEAAERGPMIGGSPMHPREVMDRHLGELVSKNIAAAIRGSDAPK